MTDYEIYILIVCIVVFVLLIALAAISLTAIVKMTTRLIRIGANDRQLRNEQRKAAVTGQSFWDIFVYIFGILLSVLFIAAAVLSTYMNFQKASSSYTVPTLRVVQSESMSAKNEYNTYLDENGLDDQFDMFDIVLTYKMPEESELELYDIVVYEVDDELVIHRIIAIEEPTDSHPDCRWFTLRGDNVQYSDSATVTYDQMLGIYRGERVRFVGSFILFMQAPAGWMCVLLIVGAVILIPVLGKHIGKIKEKRLDKLRKRELQELIDGDRRRRAEEAASAEASGGTYARQQYEYNKDGFYDIYEPDLHLVRESKEGKK